MNKPPGANGPSEAEKAAQIENATNQMLSQVLDQQAIVRLSNLSAAKPDKARVVEQTIIDMARCDLNLMHRFRRGQIAGKMSDEMLRSLMERVSERTHKATTVKFDRRRAGLDSDDEY